jgi:PTS system mannose-specific IIB component
MVVLVRVDDRLLHGQVICSWVPHIRATTLVVASDEAAGDRLQSEIMECCGYEGLRVRVESIADAIAEALGSGVERLMLVVRDLKDAMRLYEGGIRFSRLNIGNIHHEDHGRRLSPSVMLDLADEEVLGRFKAMGVEIEIRDVPTGGRAPYVDRG